MALGVLQLKQTPISPFSPDFLRNVKIIQYAKGVYFTLYLRKMIEKKKKEKKKKKTQLSSIQEEGGEKRC